MTDVRVLLFRKVIQKLYPTVIKSRNVKSSNLYNGTT
jgi:hypothetical protein